MRLADVLIVGRGGGSVEDLWAFNEEPVARAIARSVIPVISAVGHQDDWTIADFVADWRASTPTDAAKWLVHEQEARREQARELTERLLETMRAALDEHAQRLESLAARLRLLHPMNQLERYVTRVQELDDHMISAMRYTLESHEQQVQGLAGRLQALSPLAVLARGYSITFRLPERRVVTSAASLHVGDELETSLARGTVVSTIMRLSREAHASSLGE